MQAMEPRPTEDRDLADSAPRRTWLAAERTYLAWLRTGLGALGLALAVGRLLPRSSTPTTPPSVCWAPATVCWASSCSSSGAYRAQRVRSALAAGRPVPADFWEIWALTVLSIALAVVTIVLVLAEV